MTLRALTWGKEPIYYVQKSYRKEDGKNATKNVERLGTLADLKSRFGEDDPIGGAKKYIAELTADAQELSGTILVGDNSALTLSLLNGSSFTGCMSGEITDAEGNAVSSDTGRVDVIIDETSTWTLTSDTYITSFEGDPACINANGYSLYVDRTLLEGVR